MDPSKVAAVVDWPAPQGHKDVQRFMGMANYYAAYVQNFASIAAPITDLLQQSRAFHWGA